MFEFPDFEKIQRDNKRRGDEARMSADDSAKPEIGRYYTVSPDFRFGDRSWTDDIWKPVAFSGPNVMVEIRCPSRWEKVEHLGLFVADERAWYPADDLVAAISAQEGR